MLPAIEEVVKWYSLPSVPSHLSLISLARVQCVECVAILREARLPEPALSQPTHSGKVASGQPSAALDHHHSLLLWLHPAQLVVGIHLGSRLGVRLPAGVRRPLTFRPLTNSSSKSEKQCRPRPRSARRRPVPFRRIPAGPLGVSGRG